MSSTTTRRVPTTGASRHGRAAITALAMSLPIAFLAPVGASTAAPGSAHQPRQNPGPVRQAPLDLGAPGLLESRT